MLQAQYCRLNTQKPLTLHSQLTKPHFMADKAVMFRPKEATSPQQHVPLLQQILQIKAYRQQRGGQG